MKCKKCLGLGQITIVVNAGRFRRETCEDCKGTGEVQDPQ